MDNRDTAAGLRRDVRARMAHARSFRKAKTPADQTPVASIPAPAASLTAVDELRMYYWLEPLGQSPTPPAEIIAGLMRMVAGRNANEVPVTRFCRFWDDVLHNERGCAKGCPCHAALRYLGIIEIGNRIAP